MRLLWDIETDGLLQELTKVHCVSAVDVDSSYSRFYTGNQIKDFLEYISNPAIELIGHNIINFDLQALKKVYGWTPVEGQKITDTLILAQLLFPDLKNEDADGTHGAPGKIFSGKDTGSHSLRAWGQRCKCFKGDYAGGWEIYNDEMGKYCIQDTNTNKTVFHFLESRIADKLCAGSTAIELEHSIAPILARQQNYGVLFNKEVAEQLIVTLVGSLIENKQTLQDIFKPRTVNADIIVPKRPNLLKGYVVGVPFQKTKVEEFNPGSRQQIISRLRTEFGWDPTEFTEKGNPKMNEDIIENLPFKELYPLKAYLTIKKRLSQIEGGKQAWMNKIGKDGRIRGGINQNGTVTGRMAHFGPNLGQVPAAYSLYGKECRELFIAGKGKILIGVDADALEMRCLAAYLAPLDGGKFRDSILHGSKDNKTDPHSINAEAMGIDRETAKTVFYAWIYGAKNAKVGRIIMEAGVDLEQYVDNFEKEVESMITWARKKGSEKTDLYWKCWIVGKECLARLGDRIPELNQLKMKVLEKVKERGYIKGLDGRKLIMRAEHGQLNMLLQSAGALIMKVALYLADQEMQSMGLVPGKDYEYVLNVHDENDLEVTDSPEIIEKVSNVLNKCINDAALFFNFPCEQKSTVKVGKNWYEIH
jgi:DNA polymerase-1